MLKPDINLLQPELLAKSPLMTLRNVVLIWLLALVVMVSLTLYTDLQKTQLAKQSKQLVELNQQLKSENQRLQTQLTNHKASSALTAELETLTALLANKRYLYQHLTNTDFTYVGGFAQAMAEISRLHSSDISLTQIVIDDADIALSGMARNANAVPTWLSNFEGSNVLGGRMFHQFSMATQANNLIEFTVGTSATKQVGAK
ncbi:PilN domain-containing protein [Colwellia sp. MEBiC06753]